MKSTGKIKTSEQLAALLGPRPRSRTVAMAHGVFDIVHPGHIRHLQYAKGKADVLVASLTADRHVDKGRGRPHVPQELRAENLAALEAVDYVLIDFNAEPLENIRALQPDYFAKGYEYRDTRAKTEAEAAAVASYGGQIMFTPGDVVYSSSRILSDHAPALGVEKLLAVMQRADVTFESLRSALGKFDGIKVHVVGDTIVDSQTYGTVIGGQPKTPTLSVRYERREDFLGGAGIVAKHLKAAGADVRITTVIGNDLMGQFALDQFDAAGVTCRALHEPARPTTHKHSMIAGGYRLLKLDTVDDRSIPDWLLCDLCHEVARHDVDAVVCSDFRHGIYNRRTIQSVVDSIRAPFRVADSQVASRWGNITDFRGFHLITPNEREARFALGDQDSGVRILASDLFAAAQCRAMLLKLGERGLIGCRGMEHEDLDAFFALDSFADQASVVDPVGAGDALLAYATLGQLATGSLAIAGILGGIAAGLECERDGNLEVTPAEVVDRINRLEEQAGYGSRHQL